MISCGRCVTQIAQDAGHFGRKLGPLPHLVREPLAHIHDQGWSSKSAPVGARELCPPPQAARAIQDGSKAHQFNHHEWGEPFTPSTLIYEQVVHYLLGFLPITPCEGDTIRDARVRLHHFDGSTVRGKRIKPTPGGRQDLV